MTVHFATLFYFTVMARGVALALNVCDQEGVLVLERTIKKLQAWIAQHIHTHTQIRQNKVR